ncbi:glycosyltransferase family 2 protein [Candidatus Shapirobacteria bacterium]|nr:glycosyltransferase family 2 protein [Candidatus Shapirobacteria bacterium]
MNYIFDELSLFLPCYNEEGNLQSTFDKTLPIIQKVAKKWEIIIVDDGSKDNTGKIALNIQKEFPQNIQIVTHHPNRGYGAAFKSGFYTAKYQWITFIDADGQFDFNDIFSLRETQKRTNADMVIGHYLGRKVSSVRIVGTKIWQLAVFVLFGLKVTDIDCGFKLVSKKVIDTIPKLEAERGPFISSEFLIKSKHAGFKIVESGVHHYPRKAGTATGSKINVVISGLKDLLRLWYKLNFTK